MDLKCKKLNYNTQDNIFIYIKKIHTSNKRSAKLTSFMYTGISSRCSLSPINTAKYIFCKINNQMICARKILRQTVKYRVKFNIIYLHRLSRRYAALSLSTLVFSIFLEAFEISGTSWESSLMHVFNLFRRCFSAKFLICLLELKKKNKLYNTNNN